MKREEKKKEQAKEEYEAIVGNVKVEIRYSKNKKKLEDFLFQIIKQKMER